MSSTFAAIIQSRTGSTRYPGKALRPLAGVPMTEHIIRRVQHAGVFDRIVLAVPDSSSENDLVTLAQRMRIDSFKGTEEDVLLRFIQAGDWVRADRIVRICGDNPLIDISLMKSLVHHHSTGKADLTVASEPIPLGTGSEAVSLDTLKQIAEKTTKKPYREHVTTYIYDHPVQYRILKIPPPAYLQGKRFRLTVDTEKDFLLMDRLYGLFYEPSLPIVDVELVIHYLETHPETANMNANIIQKNWRSEF